MQIVIKSERDGSFFVDLSTFHGKPKSVCDVMDFLKCTSATAHWAPDMFKFIDLDTQVIATFDGTLKKCTVEHTGNKGVRDVVDRLTAFIKAHGDDIREDLAACGKNRRGTPNE